MLLFEMAQLADMPVPACPGNRSYRLGLRAIANVAKPYGFPVTRKLFPKLRTQALSECLPITAVSALRHAAQPQPWQPPNLWGSDRDHRKQRGNLNPETDR